MRRALVGAVAGLGLGLCGMGCDDGRECDPIEADCPQETKAGVGPYWLCAMDDCPEGELCMKLGDEGRAECVSRCADVFYCMDTSLECRSLGSERVCVSAGFADESPYVD